MDSLRMRSPEIVQGRRDDLLAEARAAPLAREGGTRPSLRAIQLTLSARARRSRRPSGAPRLADPWLTALPCRLPSGEMGLVAVVFTAGEWTLVCRPAG
jgi:hypothetical protein